jgi:ABC-type taurine transport system ATPase subunit
MVLLPVPQPPIKLGFIPRLLLGPSGCGKSTLLGSIAADLPPATPIVMVRMRLPSLSPSGAAGAAVPEREVQALMDETARQIFSQIGFPLRTRKWCKPILNRKW